MKQLTFPFKYEPSSQHTLESFKERMKARQEAANQTFEGSVNDNNVIYLRDESGFGECVIPADLTFNRDCERCEECECDPFDEVKGG